MLALPAGDRRMANVRKLMRMARDYEAEQGRDLRGFIDAVAERDLIAEREGEAPLEAEQLDAVRLMTVHRAKGLEFPVVCVADLGKDGREEAGALRISDDGQIGLRLASLGAGAVDTEELERIKLAQREADEAEERRIFYVAATRAEEHLILSGATDLADAAAGQGAGRAAALGLARLLPRAARRGCRAACTRAATTGGRCTWRWQRLTPATLDELLDADDRRPVRPPPAEAGGGEQARLDQGAPPAPRALPVSRLSYSGLAAYKRCSYRFYLEKALGLPGGRALEPGALGVPGARRRRRPWATRPRESDELSPLLRGTLVHALLEHLDFRRPAVPSAAEVAALIERSGAAVARRSTSPICATWSSASSPAS